MRFTHAIVRPPAATFAEGITSSRLGLPTWRSPSTSTTHTAGPWSAWDSRSRGSCRIPSSPTALSSRMPPSSPAVAQHSPDPGAASRAGEISSVGRALERWFPDLDRIVAPGTVDGGDVCEAGDHFFIGVSERTNSEGAAQLAAWLARRGFGSSVIEIRGMPRPAASQDRAFLARRTTAARGRRARRARGARRMGSRTGAGGRGVRGELRPDQRCGADGAGVSGDERAARRAGLRRGCAGDVGIPEDGRRVELPVGSMVNRQAALLYDLTDGKSSPPPR